MHRADEKCPPRGANGSFANLKLASKAGEEMRVSLFFLLGWLAGWLGLKDEQPETLITKTER